jgi:WhiB family redox-sensing transcriptional regulator
MSQLEQLLCELAGAPALPGARCRGRHHLFDPAAQGEGLPTVEQRHAQALGLCQHCLALNPCRAWVATLPPKQRPQGVVAGTIG